MMCKQKQEFANLKEMKKTDFSVNIYVYIVTRTKTSIDQLDRKTLLERARLIIK